MTVKTQDLRSRKKKLVLDRIIFFFLWFSFFFLTSTKQFRRRLLQTVDLKNELTTTYWAFPFKRASIAHRPIYFNETINPKKKRKECFTNTLQGFEQNQTENTEDWNETD